MVARGQRVYLDAEHAALRVRLRDEMKRASTHVRLRRLADDLVTDVEVAERIEALGFGGAAARVFDLLPLVHVAWADGQIQRKEREAIFRILRARGIGPEDRPAQAIAALLEERPSPEFMDEALALCREVVRVRGQASARTVLELCDQVARAAGGLLGIRSAVSPEERAALVEIAGRLDVDAEPRG